MVDRRPCRKIRTEVDGPKQPKRPMLEHVLFEPPQNDVALTGTDITTQTVIAMAMAMISPFIS